MSSTSTVRYYNFCTGWAWLWSDLAPEARFGVWFQTQGLSDVPNLLVTAWQLAFPGAPSGYGYTGTLSVHRADAQGCPLDPPISSQPWLPPPGGGWTSNSWGGVPVPPGEPGWVLLLTNGAAEGNPMSLWTDRPSAGPTGPAACGTCYPVTRHGHSFYYGTTGAPLCPGTPLVDGTCAAELAFEVWGTITECTSCSIPTGVGGSLEAASWGRLKALYR